MYLISENDYITDFDIWNGQNTVKPGMAVHLTGALVWNDSKGNFDLLTKDEYNERIKQEQSQRLEREGATYDDYQRWANGWASGSAICHGDTRDESTLRAFIVEKRRRDLERKYQEWLQKQKTTPCSFRIRSRARRVRRAGRHVSRSFVTAGIDSGGGGDDGGGDGDGQSDCHEVAFAHSRKAQFVVVSARFGGLALNDRINTIATRKRALPALDGTDARSGGRFFIPLWRWAA